MPSTDTETALLLVCPAAEHAVAAERARLDRAAQDGVPAHITVIYPFKPINSLTASDHRRLEHLAAVFEPFSIRTSRSGWFGDQVVYLVPDDPAPITCLTRSIWSAFPDFPPYAGRFAEVIPHLTIGHDHPVHELEAAERAVSRRLPFTQQIDQLGLWAGPAVEGRTEPAHWRQIRSYRLGRAPSTAGA